MVRVKKRYLILQITDKSNNKVRIDLKSLKTAIIKAVNTLHGDYGATEVHNEMCVKYSNENTGIYYIKVNRSVNSLLSSAISLITSIDDILVNVSVVHTAATLRHANIFLISHHKAKPDPKLHGKKPKGHTLNKRKLK